MNINFTIQGRDISFQMDHDPSFVACANTKLSLDRHGACEPEVMHVMARALREGDYAVDGGANIGFFTLFMAKLVGPTGRVLACEPGSNNLPKLKDNIARNKLTNVYIEERPLWNRSGVRLPFYLARDSGNNALCANDVTIRQEDMDSTTLSHAVTAMYQKAPREIEVPKLVKLDIEGAERRALEGFAGVYLHYVANVICELNEPALQRMGSSRHDVRKFMLGHGFSTYLLREDGELPRRVPPETRIESDLCNLNVLFSKATNVGETWPTVEVHRGG